MTKLTLAGAACLAAMLIAGCPLTTNPFVDGVRVETTLGEFVIELDPYDAPITVDNFLQYVDEGFYAGTIIHRVVPGFVIQGGGYDADLTEKDTHDPIVNEAATDAPNLRAAVAMARTNDPNSATSQFFINLADNADLDASDAEPGYAVFGRVVTGLDVIDAIAAVPTETRGGLENVPVDDVVIESVERIVLPREIELTEYGELYLDEKRYQAMELMRDLLVDILSLGIWAAFS